MADRKKVLIVYHESSVEPAKDLFNDISKYFEVALLTPKEGLADSGRYFKNYNKADKGSKYKVFYGTVLNFKKNIRNFYLFGFLRAIISFKPEIIHVFDEAYSKVLFQAIILKLLFFRRVKICFYGYENIPYKNKSKNKKKMFFIDLFVKFCFKFIDGGLCASTEATNMLKTLGFKKEIMTAPWGISDKYFYPKEVSSFKKNLFPADSFVLGYVGRLVKNKGIIELINLISILPNNYYLLIIGGGELEKEIKIIIADKKISSRIVLVQSLPESELINYYNIMDVLILNSKTTETWKEQYGRVLIEAMACGKVVFGSSSGAIPEVIGREEFVFAEGDLFSIKERIERLYLDKEYYKKSSKLFYNRFLSKYSLNAFSRRVEALYNLI